MNVHVGGFKVGDRVRVGAHPYVLSANEHAGVITGRPSYGLRGDWDVDLDNYGSTLGFFESELTQETLRIEAGKFYKTRDGRKVGPMLKEHTSHPASQWSSPEGQLGNFGSLWCIDGKYYTHSESCRDLIAEWPAEPETAKPALPKFKVGDRVDYGLDGKPGCDGWKGTIITQVHIMPNGRYEYTGVHSVEGQGRFNETWLFSANTTPSIVCLIENGQPKPATRPYVHPDRTSAEKESKRLASLHKGQEFGVYELVSTTKEERTYAHEWQRLAKTGSRLLAQKELQRLTGLSGGDAWDAMRAWLYKN